MAFTNAAHHSIRTGSTPVNLFSSDRLVLSSKPTMAAAESKCGYSDTRVWPTALLQPVIATMNMRAKYFTRLFIIMAKTDVQYHNTVL